MDHIAFVYYKIKPPNSGGLGVMINELMKSFFSQESTEDIAEVENEPQTQVEFNSEMVDVD